MHELQWLEQALRKLLVLSHYLYHCPQIREAWHDIKLLPFYLDLPLDAIYTASHQFCLFGIDLHFIPCACFVESFKLGLLVPAVS